MRRLALVLVALIGSSGLAQSRPESSASRPDRKVSVRRAQFPVTREASVPSGCSFSPDGRFLALAFGYDGHWLVVLEVQTRAIVFEDRCPDPQKLHVRRPQPANWPPSFSWKSDRIAYTRDESVVVVELEKGEWRAREPIPLPFKPGILYPCPRTIAWSSDDSSLMLAERGEGVFQIDVGRGAVRRLDSGPRRVFSGTFLEKGVNLVSFGDEDGFDSMLFVDGVPGRTLKGMAFLAASADRGTWLVQTRDPPASGADSRPSPDMDAMLRTHVEIRDAVSQKPRARLKGLVNLAAFSADGRILVTSESHVVVIHDGRTGAVLLQLDHYQGDRVVALAISPDGRHLLTMGRPTDPSDSGTVLWDLAFE